MKPADDVSLPRKKNLGRSKITTKMWREGERKRERVRERERERVRVERVGRNRE